MALEITTELKTTPPEPEPPREEEKFELELPEELKDVVPAPGEEKTEPPAGGTGAPAAETEPAAEAEPSKPRRLVPKEALDAERAKRKAATESRFAEVEALRQRYDAELARIRQEQRRPAPTTDFNQLTDLNEVAAKLRDELRQEYTSHLATLQQGILSRQVVALEKAFVKDNPDYYDVLDRSGVQAAITINPETGRAADPFLHQFLFSQADPVEAAYEYAQGRLSGTTKTAAEARGAERGRREIVEKVLTHAARPRGIAALPSSSASKTGLTRRDVDRMSEEQRKRLFKARPDLQDWWLG